jgi:hypothetical protein
MRLQTICGTGFIVCITVPAPLRRRVLVAMAAAVAVGMLVTVIAVVVMTPIVLTVIVLTVIVLAAIVPTVCVRVCLIGANVDVSGPSGSAPGLLVLEQPELGGRDPRADDALRRDVAAIDGETAQRPLQRRQRQPQVEQRPEDHVARRTGKTVEVECFAQNVPFSR